MFWKKKEAVKPQQARVEQPEPKVEQPQSRAAAPEQAAVVSPKAGIIPTRAEVLQKIQQLTEPGSTVLFYLSGSTASGGPLGRGAAIVELNPNYPGPRQKKYAVYTADVEGMQPVGKRRLWFTSDKANELAEWIKERQDQR